MKLCRSILIFEHRKRFNFPISLSSNAIKVLNSFINIGFKVYEDEK